MLKPLEMTTAVVLVNTSRLASAGRATSLGLRWGRIYWRSRGSSSRWPPTVLCFYCMPKHLLCKCSWTSSVYLYICKASAERNYHIFYQLCASRELPEMRCLKLGETWSHSRPPACQQMTTFTLCLSTVSIMYSILSGWDRFAFLLQMHLSVSATPAREERCRYLVLMICQTWSALAMLSPFWVELF